MISILLHLDIKYKSYELENIMDKNTLNNPNIAINTLYDPVTYEL